MEIIDYIPTSTRTKKKYITCKEISDMSGYSQIFIRSEINRLRSSGVPVCSSRHGYYLSDDENDICKTISSMLHRISAQERAINGLKTLLHK